MQVRQLEAERWGIGGQIVRLEAGLNLNYCRLLYLVQQIVWW